MRRLATALACIAALAALAGDSTAAQREIDILRRATAALSRSLAGPRGVIPAAVMRRARAIAVFPRSPIQSGLHFGYGAVGARSADGQRWLVPAIVSVKAVAPIPAGMRAGDLLLVAISRRGFDFLAQDPAVLPADLHIPPGPTAADADVAMDADILGYARYGRLFAGIRIDELVIFEDTIGITQLYGRAWSLRELLFGAVETGPPAATSWRRSLEGYFGEIR